MPPSDPPPTSNPTAHEFTRLHITPLDAELFKIIVPASAAPNARNVSYHTIETFPEKRYGFVDLPVADAEKLRVKLNGAVLKGSKMRIEKARPEPTMEPTEVVSKKEKKDKKKSKDKDGSKKRKRDDNVEDGIQLSDRKVKRGWTETTDDSIKRKKKDRSEKSSKSKDKDEEKSKEKKEKKRTKTKYTDGAECLLKTQIPPNKDLPDKDKADKKRKKRGNEREVTVHEFEKTTRFPSFLKDTTSKAARAEAEYVEGQGWVDQDGNVVEAVVEKKPKKVKKDKKPAPKKKPTPEPESASDTSSSGTSSDDEPEVDEKPAKAVKSETKEVAGDDSDSDTSSDGSSSEEDTPKSVDQATPVAKSDNARPESSGSSRSLTIKIPPPDSPSDAKVHPLEALYKRKKPNGNETETPAKEAQPFSFFGGEDYDEEEENSDDQGEAPVMPMTPFTKQDFEWRNVRSAAPTPDTAHPSRMQNFWASQDDEDDEMDDVEEEDEGDEAQAPTDGDRATSDFQNWFWENRRDLNQSWMKRRKTVAKEKRHRENKARASKAV